MEIFQTILVFIIGAMFGSAANALIDRLPREESWFTGRSHCDKCGHTLEFEDLIPIFSYLYLAVFNNTPSNPPLNLSGGRKPQRTKRPFLGAGCRYCGAPIPYRNLLVEIFMGIGFVAISYFGNLSNLGMIVLMGILWVTTIIAVMDWETKLVSEVMVVVWGVLVLLLNLSNLSNLGNLGGLAAAAGVIGGLWAVTRGKAMGFGDVEIAIVMGWWLGWPKIATGLWIAFVVGAIIGVIKLIKRLSDLKSEIAFGPFLVLGAWVGWLWGDVLWHAMGIR